MKSRVTRIWRQVARRIDGLGIVGWALVLGAAALIARLALLLTYDERPPGTDSREYLALADRLAAGEGFPGDGFRTPGYPAFIALLQQLPGRREDAVIVAQHLLGVLLVLAILGFTWRFFGRGAALLAAGLAACAPNVATLESWVLADFLLGFLTFLAVAAVALAIEREGAARWLVGAGVLIGAACYVKPAGQFLLPAAVLAIILATRDLRRSVRWSAVVVGSASLVIAPWVIRTAAHTGEPALSTQSGVTLFHRLFDRDRAAVPRTEPGGNLLRDIQLEIARNHGRCPTTCLVQPQASNRYFLRATNELLARGYSRAEVLDIQRRLATEAMARQPFRYAWGTGVATVSVYTDANRFIQHDADRGSRSYAQRVRDLGLRGPLLALVLAGLWLLQAVSTLTLVLGAIGLVPLLMRSRGRARTGAWTVAMGWLLLAGMTAATHGGLWRYSQSLAPLTWVLAAAGVAALVSAVRSRPAPGPRRRPTRGEPASPGDA